MSSLNTRKRKKPEAKRPEVKSIKLHPVALAVWKTHGYKHNWSEELSAVMIGRYSKSMPPDQKILFLEEMKRGYAIMFAREEQELKARKEYVLQAIEADIQDQRQLQTEREEKIKITGGRQDG